MVHSDFDVFMLKEVKSYNISELVILIHTLLYKEMCVCVCIFTQTFRCRQDMTQGQCLSWAQLVWIQFSLDWLLYQG